MAGHYVQDVKRRSFGYAVQSSFDEAVLEGRVDLFQPLPQAIVERKAKGISTPKFLPSRVLPKRDNEAGAFPSFSSDLPQIPRKSGDNRRSVTACNGHPSRQRLRAAIARARHFVTCNATSHSS